MQIDMEDFEIVGHFGVDSGQAMVGDPCYLDGWNTNENDEWDLEGKIGEYSYQGASATTIDNLSGSLGGSKAVVFNTGYGDGVYPVYAKFNEDGRITKIVINFIDEDDEDEDEDDAARGKPEVVSAPTWGSFRDFWVNCELTITPRLLGFIDIEGGHVGISGKWLEACSSCTLEISCTDCGRDSSNYLHLRAGDGDGIYSAFEISFEERVVGAFLMLDDFGYTPALMESISEAESGHEEDPKVLEEFYVNFYENFYKSIGDFDQSLQMHFFGEIKADENPIDSRSKNAGILILGESGQGKDSSQSLVTLNNILPGSYRTFVFANRDEENNNILVPRSVLILEVDSAEEIGLTKDFAKSINLTEEYMRWNESSVFARIGKPQASYAISVNEDWSNLEFARELRVEDFDKVRIITTTFDKKALILGQLWIKYKGEDEWMDFFIYNDLGLTLAFAYAEGIIKHTITLEQYVNETWDLFLDGLDVEDSGFEDIRDLLEED